MLNKELRTLNYGTNLNMRNSVGETHLHCELEINSLNICRILVGEGVVIDSKDNSGNIPLCIAISKGQLSTNELLFKK